MAEKEKFHLEGEMIAVSMMLRQLYVIASSTHGGADALAAWRADIEAELRKVTSAMSVGDDAAIEMMAATSMSAIAGVFDRIT